MLQRSVKLQELVYYSSTGSASIECGVEGVGLDQWKLAIGALPWDNAANLDQLHIYRTIRERVDK